MYQINLKEVIARDSWYDTRTEPKVYSSNFNPKVLEDAVNMINNRKFLTKKQCLSDKIFIQSLIDFLKKETKAPSPLLIIMGFTHIFDLNLKNAQDLYHYPSCYWEETFEEK